MIRDTLKTTGPLTQIAGCSEELVLPLSDTKLRQVKAYRHLRIFVQRPSINNESCYQHAPH